MGKVLKFEFYEKDKLCTKVSVDYSIGTVNVENFTDDVVEQAFGNREVCIEDIDDFFRSRIFAETRVDKDTLLGMLGLKVYDPEAICRKTHGMLIHDFNWIKFDGEDISYSDIAKKRGW